MNPGATREALAAFLREQADELDRMDDGGVKMLAASSMYTVAAYNKRDKPIVGLVLTFDDDPDVNADRLARLDDDDEWGDEDEVDDDMDDEWDDGDPEDDDE